MRFFIFAALAASFTTQVIADDAKLKRSCLKKYPIMQGIHDAELITMFGNICDKNNQGNQNAYLIQVTQRFQQLGLTYHALQLLGSLEAQGLNHEQLTRVKFLIGTQLTHDSLKVMQVNQSQILAESSTIQAATALRTNLQQLFTVPIEENKVEQIEQVHEKVRQPIKRKAKVQVKRPTTLTTPVKQTQNKQPTPFTNL